MFLKFTAIFSFVVIMSYAYRQTLVAIITETILKLINPDAIIQTLIKHLPESITKGLHSDVALSYFVKLLTNNKGDGET